MLLQFDRRVMTGRTIRIWSWLHKWTSLLCTLFLLMLCLTGLPLIFHDEIDRLTEAPPAYGAPGVASSGTAPVLLPLDIMARQALDRAPGEVLVFMAFDNEQPAMTITTAPRPDSPAAEMTLHSFDRSTGDLLWSEAEAAGGVMHFLLQLHTDMFLGLPGMLFLGLMGVLFAIALVSGVVLYLPFTRKLPFGSLRITRRPRVKWLDYHNLLGIAALAWMMVVGLTGIINALSTPIYQLWQAGELADMTDAYARQPSVKPNDYGSLDLAMAQARRALPGFVPQFIAFPGGAFSSGHHYAVFFQGSTPLTQRLLTPALIDARSGAFTDARAMPWYVSALALSQPLHFGDYGGLPLKMLWAALTLFTIIVLVTGLYLWLAKRAANSRRAAEERFA
ncbi:PepSY-associated TM helix domain-containing protein [Croceibacterium ferulae]|uniref:PepSY-associated TM helix domain-containing protein n=1 Tax=Croceibacterium ferulae TaxID=1854641 RepID=UPI001F4D521F|nr:PepSY-associated TM helix domain-containing protein [Croceibacterium ferulae]